MRAAVVALLVLAVALNSGWLFSFVVLLALLQLATRLWIARAGDGLRVTRRCERRVFFDETVEVTLEVTNTSALPLPWITLRDHLPPALILPSTFNTVFRLAAGETRRLTYRLPARRRGYHTIGPLVMTMGDVIGLAQRTVWIPTPRYLIVYPRIVSLHSLELPTRALFGDISSRRKILGDPTRLAGIREYTPGDALHDIHWRATARSGSLQVKQFQPSTTVHTMIALDMDPRDYATLDAATVTDHAVTVAASVASHMIGRRQEVGLWTNGQVALPPQDDHGDEYAPLVAGPAVAALSERSEQSDRERSGTRFAAAPIRFGTGHSHLMRVLELLARIEPREAPQRFETILLRESLELPWGSTVVAVTGAPSDSLFVTLHRLRESGLLVVLLLAERPADLDATQARAAALGVRLHVAATHATLTSMLQ